MSKQTLSQTIITIIDNGMVQGRDNCKFLRRAAERVRKAATWRKQLREAQAAIGRAYLAQENMVHRNQRQLEMLEKEREYVNQLRAALSLQQDVCTNLVEEREALRVELNKSLERLRQVRQGNVFDFVSWKAGGQPPAGVLEQ